MKTEYTIFPALGIKRRKPKSFEISTFLRKQNDNGMWYLCHFYKEFSNDLSPEKAIQMVLHEVYRFSLFGIVPEVDVVKNPITGRDMFVLDENQYSEHGRLYLQDDLCFPKTNSPIPAHSVIKPYHFELQTLWERQFKTE